MRTNTKIKSEPVFTHGGAFAQKHLSDMQILRRTVLSCLLWEDQFYEDGVAIADRIVTLAKTVPVRDLAKLAIEARKEFNLRHVPLLLLSVLADRARGDSVVADTIAAVINRADELSEFLAVFAKYKGVPTSKIKKVLTHGIRAGLALAFTKFNAYSLAKYNRDEGIKLRDVLFLSHAKPKDVEQAATWQALIDGKLASPDTWEVELSAGKDKKATFERLIRENKLGYFALIRNLRNMVQAKVDPDLVREAILARKGGAEKLFPFRFIAAAKAAPVYEEELDQAFVANLQAGPKLPGSTLVVIDVSGSMYCGTMSAKSDMNRAQAASALGAVMRETCEKAHIFATAGNDCSRVHQTERVPARHGMALTDAIYGMSRPLGGGGIFLKQVCDYLREEVGDVDRMIVITDEQDCGLDAGDRPTDAVPLGKRNYIINVASYQNGIGYKPRWTHIDGFSEGVVKYIYEAERATNAQ